MTSVRDLSLQPLPFSSREKRKSSSFLVETQPCKERQTEPLNQVRSDASQLQVALKDGEEYLIADFGDRQSAV